MNYIRKIFTILDKNDIRMLIFMFCIIFLTTIFEILNIGSLLALANLIINEIKFNELLNNYNFLNILFADKEVYFILKIFVSIAIILLICKSIILVLFFWIKNKFLFNFEVKLRDKLYKKYLRQNYNFFLKNDSSELIRNINTEVGNFRFIALQTPVQIVFDLLLISIIGISLIIIRPIETIALLSFFSLIICAYYFFLKPYIKRWGEKRVETETKIIKNLVEAFNSIKEILIYKKKNYFIKKNYIDNSRLANINMINYFVSELPRHILELTGVGIILLYIYYLSQSNIYNTEEIIFTLTLFSISLYKLLPSFLRVSNSLQSLKFGSPVIDIIFNDLKIPENNILINKNNKIIDFKNCIELKNVNFNYGINNTSLIKNLNLKINKNESIVIIGDSGSGKSTILNLLSGFIKPDSGNIFSDKIDIHENLDMWQSKIAWLDQKVFLLDDTVKNNIVLYEDEKDIDNDKLKESINLASLGEMIDKKLNDIDTLIGEKNKFISGGEAQRIALARAFYRNSEILILDEFTLNLDARNTRIILDSLEILKKTKTIIAVTHDESIIDFFETKIYIKDLNKS